MWKEWRGLNTLSQHYFLLYFHNSSFYKIRSTHVFLGISSTSHIGKLNTGQTPKSFWKSNKVVGVTVVDLPTSRLSWKCFFLSDRWGGAPCDRRRGDGGRSIIPALFCERCEVSSQTGDPGQHRAPVLHRMFSLFSLWYCHRSALCKFSVSVKSLCHLGCCVCVIYLRSGNFLD